MNFFCWAIGHKRIINFDGGITCARCRQKLQPGAVDQMREIDPDWYLMWHDAPISVAVTQFQKRNPGSIMGTRIDD